MIEPGKDRVDFTLFKAATEGPYDDEGLFARDVNGQLIRVEKATASDFDCDVRLSIDGVELSVKKAVPQRDSQGNIIRDSKGQPIPRHSTIYDAASLAFVQAPGDRNPIPTLCHQEHLPPVGVCRVCVVEAAEQSRRGMRRMLVPACVQHVSEGMQVHTLESTADPQAASRVRTATETIVELLVADHLKSADGGCRSLSEAGPGNELARLSDRLGIRKSRFQGSSTERGRDHSSHIIKVDHDQCILCGRCMRGCNWLKHNNVIGQTRKGYATTISFDLDQSMGTSTCVSCGECAISCPTGALEFTAEFINRLALTAAPDTQDADVVGADELATMPLFSGIPYKFLQFNGGAVVRRKLRAGDVLCREGEYGSTAFIILAGRFEIFLASERGAAHSESAKGFRGFWGGIQTIRRRLGGDARLSDVGAVSLSENQRIVLTPDDFILGEMTCMNRYPRSATVVAIEDSQVLEIRRNVLHMLQRNAVSREILDRVYRARSLASQLRNLPILQGLTEQQRQRAAEFLRDKAEIVFVDPGQVILEQGDRAANFYITKLGFVKVSQAYGRENRVLNYLGPGRYFGEIGLLSAARHLLTDDLGVGIRAGVCTATCSALDHVELIRIRGEHFQQLLVEFPEVTAPLKATALEILRNNEKMQKQVEACGSQDFLDQGLYLAQSLLVLDLERCTRCDECTRACADTHDGVTRLVREGMRFDRFLVASSCRSCLDPYCLVGCPVDAIHRNGETLEIAITDYCIGCGLCAENCPYGNINMHGFPKMEADPRTGRMTAVFQEQAGRRLPVIQQRATTCDLCRGIDGRPSCVYACPHNAAFRMTGQELLQLVERPLGMR